MDDQISGEIAQTARLAPGRDDVLWASRGSIDYDIRTVGGLKRTLFGREGLFMTHLRGPGKVLLQTLERTPLQAAATRST